MSARYSCQSAKMANWNQTLYSLDTLDGEGGDSRANFPPQEKKGVFIGCEHVITGHVIVGVCWRSCFVLASVLLV